MTFPRPTVKKVQRRTVEIFDALFQERYGEWGPARRTAVLMWRRGYFIADCYLWEEGDIRPIPGSLHPDLVLEALDYTIQHRNRIEPMRHFLREQGQWGSAICARTMMRNWCQMMKFPVDDYTDEPLDLVRKDRPKWCGDPRHDHSLPAMWQVQRVG